MTILRKMNDKKKTLLGIFAGFLLVGVVGGCGSGRPEQSKDNLLNFRHLEHLSESIRMNGRSVGIVHIYSEAPDYRWVEARGEGITCVDDVARAAVLYLRQYRSTGDEAYFRRSQALLRFVLAMQAPNGLFYNFLLPDYRINKTRHNSVNRLDFWTARAVWALGEGYEITRKNHAEFADSLRKALVRVLPAVRDAVKNYPKTEQVKGRSYPTWLINRYAADATSELLLGLVAYQKARSNSGAGDIIGKLSKGLILMQQGDWRRVPYGAHLSYPGIWHGWGNAQTEVLARIGRDGPASEAVSSAKREADWFFSRLLIGGWKSSLVIGDTVQTRKFPQIAYEVRTVALGLVNLYQATGAKKYAVLAGLAGSWLFGNNPAGAVMYDRKTGRCFDGIVTKETVNRNSGAESTIEALLTLQALQADSITGSYLFYLNRSEKKTVRAANGNELEYRLYSDRQGRKIVVFLDLSRGKMDVMEPDRWNHFIEPDTHNKNGGL